jgi:hypothetical protein
VSALATTPGRCTGRCSRRPAPPRPHTQAERKSTGERRVRASDTANGSTGAGGGGSACSMGHGAITHRGRSCVCRRCLRCGVLSLLPTSASQ